MKIGIIGSGGREHALCHYLSKSQKVKKIYCFPGNAGASLIAENVLIGADNLLKFHKWNNWEKITRLAKIAIFPRKNYSSRSLSPVVSKKLDKKDFIYIKAKKINISSSLIRKYW